MAWGLSLGLVSSAMPVVAGADPQPQSQPNRRVPEVQPVPQSPTFSAFPTDEEVFRTRVFSEPLVPIGPTTPEENAALARGVMAYLQAGGGENTADLEALLEARKVSPWRPSLRLNLGIVYRRTGYFNRAVRAWEEAWAVASSATDTRGKAVADRAVGELAQLHARLGNRERLEQIFTEIEGRDIGGSAGEMLAGAKQGLWEMQNRPERSFRCGPLALDRMLASSRAGYTAEERLVTYPSTSTGTSLLEMRTLATEFQMGLQPAFRTSATAAVLVPALVHWKAGHFAALVKEENERYLIQDPTFGVELWVSRRAFDEETSGYMLVRDGALPSGWRPVPDTEAGTIRGKGQTAASDPERYRPEDPKCPCDSGGSGGGGGGGGSGGGGGAGGLGGGTPSIGSSSGMPRYAYHTMLVNLNLTDTPVGYSPPRGPAVALTLTYNQREVFQPQTFNYGNVGSKWNYSWQSYITDDPVTPSQPVNRYVRGGGQETYTGFNAGTQSYARHPDSRAQMVRVSTSPIRYELRRIDGSVEEYGQPDGALTFPRKVFLTRLIDAQGNALVFTYDASLRLVAVTDAIGQVTTLSYQLPDPLKITKVTDPFGRFATLTYDGSGRLSSITDVIGMVSSFQYGASDFISALTTPYGTTTFAGADVGRRRWLETTDPLGGRERLEYVNISSEATAGAESVADMPGYLDGPEFPTGYNLGPYQNLNTRNTYFWSKLAMARAPGKYSAARLMHWLHGPGGAQTSGVIENVKEPLESKRTFYKYADQPSQQFTGSYGQPTGVARVTENGSSEIYQYEYNARGRTTKVIDPLGRETVYVYGTSNVPDANPTTGEGIDLLQIKRKNGALYDTIASYTYNTQHLPLTSTDALGKVTTYTYNAQGQVLTVTTPKAQGQSQGATTTFTYNPNSYLTEVSGPVPGANTTFTYDTYGRRRTVTDSAALVLTYDYDSLDRVTNVTYPDTTYEQTTYNKLDAEKRRDRLGRTTQALYDALRRPVMTRDALGQTTQYQYADGCSSCGLAGDKLTKLIDPNGNATLWDYDVQGRVTRETRADGNHEDYVYQTTSSRPKQRIDRRNITTTLTYFLDGKLQQRSYSDATPLVSYTYSTVTGLMLTAANGTDTLTWTYDATDRVATEASTKNASTVGYSYDDAGNRTLLTLNGATHVSYAYDQQSRLTGITRASNTIGFGYDTPSRRTSMTYPNGVMTTYAYSTESHLTSITANKGATPITSFTYVLDAVGNRTRKTTLDWIEDYKYDDTYRLLSADRSTGTPSRFRFTYDASGNRTADQKDDASMGATFNNLNQLLSRQAGGVLAFKGSTNEPATVTVGGKPAQTSASNTFAAPAPVSSGTTDVAVVATDSAGNVRTNSYRVTESGTGATQTYDLNGNLTAKTEGADTWGYEWNAENELTRVTKNSVERARFSYDALGRRVEKVAVGVTATYTYAGGDVLRSISGGSTLSFVHGPRIDEPLALDDGSAFTYFHADGLGSIAKTTNLTGAVILTRQYDAWGSLEAGTTEAGYAFTGREWDAEVGLYYYRARYYDAKLGRFLSEDPTRFEGGANFFRYVANNPTRFNDPTGLQQRTPNSATSTYNCMAWGLGVTHTWIRPCDSAAGPTSPNTIPPKFGCTEINCSDKPPCNRAKVIVFEDAGDATNWHVMRQECQSNWTSKNGSSFLWTNIPDPPIDFYKRIYNPKGPVSTKCWSCPKGPGPLADKPCW
jgi:RHS repeat-associated protein